MEKYRWRFLYKRSPTHGGRWGQNWYITKEKNCLMAKKSLLNPMIAVIRLLTKELIVTNVVLSDIANWVRRQMVHQPSALLLHSIVSKQMGYVPIRQKPAVPIC